ncbi:hypothetical protein ACHAXS_013562 [Conticribra weissflogii]
MTQERLERVGVMSSALLVLCGGELEDCSLSELLKQQIDHNTAPRVEEPMVRPQCIHVLNRRPRAIFAPGTHTSVKKSFKYGGMKKDVYERCVEGNKIIKKLQLDIAKSIITYPELPSHFDNAIAESNEKKGDFQCPMTGNKQNNDQNLGKIRTLLNLVLKYKQRQIDTLENEVGSFSNGIDVQKFIAGEGDHNDDLSTLSSHSD